MQRREVSACGATRSQDLGAQRRVGGSEPVGAHQQFSPMEAHQQSSQTGFQTALPGGPTPLGVRHHSTMRDRGGLSPFYRSPNP